MAFNTTDFLSSMQGASPFGGIQTRNPLSTFQTPAKSSVLTPTKTATISSNTPLFGGATGQSSPAFVGKVDTTPVPVSQTSQTPKITTPVQNNSAMNNLAVVGNQVVESASTKPTKTEKPVSERDRLLSDVRGIIEKQGTEGDRRAELEKEQQLIAKQEELNKINAEAITVDRAYENRKRELLKNPTGMLEAQLTNEVNRLDFERGQRLADIGIRQAVAQGNVELANQIIDSKISAEFEPLKNQLDSLKTYQQFYNDDLTDSESKQLDTIIRQQEMDYQQKLDLQKIALQRQYDLEDKAIKKAEELQTTQAVIPALQDKLGSIKSLLTDSGKLSYGGAVGAWQFDPFNPFTKQKQSFIATVEQMLSQDTLQTLLNLKKAGGTLGALSEGERSMLQSAASKIGTWRKEKDGKVVGYDASEKDFATELGKIKMLTERAILEAGGTIDNDPLDIGVNQDPLKLGI